MNWKKSAITIGHSFSTKALCKRIDLSNVQGEKAEGSKLSGQFSGYRTWLCIRIPERPLHRLTKHHWGPGNLCFHQAFRAQSAASFAPLLPGEHSETGISVHQLIIKLGFLQLIQSQPVDPLRGKAFQDFLSQYKGKSIMKQSQLYLT